MLPDHRLASLGLDLLSPWDPRRVQPASVDLTLSGDFLELRDLPPTERDGVPVVDPQVPQSYTHVHVPDGGEYLLRPGTFVLGSTVERVTLTRFFVGLLSGKSSLARLGLVIESAGFLDPGFSGTVTLELANLTPYALVLRPGMAIGQLSVIALVDRADRPYGDPGLGSHYQGQEGPTGSRFTRG